MTPRLSRAASVAGLLVAALVLDADACGPFFPNRLLTDADRELTSVPVGIFADEVARILPAVPGGPSAVVATSRVDVFAVDLRIDQTEAADLADLQEALGASRWPAFVERRVLDRYRPVRAALSSRARDAGKGSDTLSPAAACETNRPGATEPPSIPSGLPWEFAEYARGALRLRAGDVAGARKAWARLLNAPAARRPYRSTWAAYMLARTTPDTDRDAALAAYRRVRSLAAEGFRDTLGLAAASLGWEARVELRSGEMRRAIQLYAEHAATGDPTALVSLSQSAALALNRSAAELSGLVRDPLCRGVMAALIVASGPSPWDDADRGAERGIRFLNAVEAAGMTDVGGADRLAWVAYRAGRFEEAERWLSRAAPDGELVRWLRAKLLLRRGLVNEAAAELHALVSRTPAAPPIPEPSELDLGLIWDGMPLDLRTEPAGRRVRGELGVLCLGRQQFSEALDLLLRGGYWDDAAYVAERVMPTGDLRAYVDASWPEGLSESGPKRTLADEGPAVAHSDAIRLRHLLGRRMVREGLGVAARPYFPAGLRESLGSYLISLAAGSDATRPAGERATALFRAARLARYDGLELMGTELEPDWYIHGGALQQSGISTTRAGADRSRLAPTSSDELKAIADTAPAPNTRFHYRYVAAQLAWSAAGLMPDQSPATALTLWEAGGWLQNRDPQASDRFYKALVRRCGHTPLGVLAERLRWFPTAKQAAEAGILPATDDR